jgi:integrase
VATIRKNASAKTGKVTYTVRYWAEGKDKERTFKTRREASDFAARTEHDKRAGTYVDPSLSRETFGQAAERMIAAKRNANTREAYRGALTHLDSILNRPLQAVANDRDGIQALCANHKQGKRMLSVIRETCAEAVKSGRLSGHRLQGLTCNHIPSKRDLIPHTPEQVDSIAAAMGNDGLAVRIMYQTGVRVSECLALRKSDFVQSVNGTWRVRVTRQIQNGVITTLKHRRDWTGREIPVPASLARLVCARPDGDLFSCRYTSFRTRFTTAARKAGLPVGTDGFTAHQLRHGYASRLLAGGIALTDVARWLGDEIRTVASTYAHLMEGQEARALAILEQDDQGKAEAAA